MAENIFAEGSELDELYGDEQFTEEDLKPKASKTCDKAGWYHVYVLSVKPETPDHTGMNSVVLLALQVLAGTNPDQKDAMIYHRVRLFKVVKDDSGKPIGREPYSKDYIAQALKAAAGLGLIPRVGAPKLSQVNWANAEGLQAVVRIDADAEKFKDKKTGDEKETTRYQINFGNFFRLDDDVKEVKACPKDAEALAMATGGAGIGGDGMDDI